MAETLSPSHIPSKPDGEDTTDTISSQTNSGAPSEEHTVEMPSTSPTGWPDYYGIPQDIGQHVHPEYRAGEHRAKSGKPALSEYERMQRDQRLLQAIEVLKNAPIIGNEPPQWDNSLLIPTNVDKEGLRAARVRAIQFIARTLNSFRREGNLVISGQRFHFPSIWLKDVVPTKIEERLQRAHDEQEVIGRRNSIEVVLTDTSVPAEPGGRELFATRIEVAYHGQYDSYSGMRQTLVPHIRGARLSSNTQPIQIPTVRHPLIREFLPVVRSRDQVPGSRYAALRETSHLFRTLAPEDPRTLQESMRVWTHYHTYPADSSQEYGHPIRHQLPHYYLEPDDVTRGSINRVLRMVEAMSWALQHTEQYREYLRLPKPGDAKPTQSTSQ